jgi:hypothetical protein
MKPQVLAKSLRIAPALPVRKKDAPATTSGARVAAIALR